jgi:hypothetical protein
MRYFDVKRRYLTTVLYSYSLGTYLHVFSLDAAQHLKKI